MNLALFKVQTQVCIFEKSDWKDSKSLDRQLFHVVRGGKERKRREEREKKKLCGAIFLSKSRGLSKTRESPRVFDIRGLYHGDSPSSW